MLTHQSPLTVSEIQYGRNTNFMLRCGPGESEILPTEVGQVPRQAMYWLMQQRKWGG